MAMPPAQQGCAYFNFSASHDGIGLRPAEGLIPDDEITAMLHAVERFGGRVSLRSLPDGGAKPYELNVSLFDAFAGTVDGPDEHQIARFLCSQAIVMGLEGIPAFYVHSLVASRNDHAGVEKLGYNRAINRRRLDYDVLQSELSDPTSLPARVMAHLKAMVDIRTHQPAFHPNATQFTLHLGDTLFGFWRQSLDRSQSIFAISNVTNETQRIAAMSLNLIEGDDWRDLLSGDEVRADTGEIVFAPYQTRWISNR